MEGCSKYYSDRVKSEPSTVLLISCTVKSDTLNLVEISMSNDIDISTRFKVSLFTVCEAHVLEINYFQLNSESFCSLSQNKRLCCQDHEKLIRFPVISVGGNDAKKEKTIKAVNTLMNSFPMKKTASV